MYHCHRCKRLQRTHLDLYVMSHLLVLSCKTKFRQHIVCSQLKVQLILAQKEMPGLVITHSHIQYTPISHYILLKLGFSIFLFRAWQAVQKRFRFIGDHRLGLVSLFCIKLDFLVYKCSLWSSLSGWPPLTYCILSFLGCISPIHYLHRLIHYGSQGSWYLS